MIEQPPTEEQCAWAVNNVHAFLHGELDESVADEVRHHLMVCEACMDDYDIESLITAMIRRCQETPTECPEHLREQISRLQVGLPRA